MDKKLPLHLAYRPETSAEVIGNDSAKKKMEAYLKKKNPPKVYLFHGPPGTGKTTMARIMAREFGAVGSDLVEVDSGDFRGVDTIRSIRQRVHLAPGLGKYRAWIMDECHRLTLDAQDAFLKALEDTPSHVFFFLCTTEAEKLRPALRSRCHELTTQLADGVDLEQLLNEVIKGEGGKVNAGTVETIIKVAEGSPRNALILLDSVIDLPPADQIKAIEEAKKRQAQAFDLAKALIAGKSWTIIRKILTDIKGEDAEGIRRLIIGFCSSVLLREDSPRAYLILESFREPTYSIGFPGVVLACYEACHG